MLIKFNQLKIHIFLLKCLANLNVFFVIECSFIVINPVLKFSVPAIITSREVIIARYKAILDQSERTHFFNYLSNYTIDN